MVLMASQDGQENLEFREHLAVKGQRDKKAPRESRAKLAKRALQERMAHRGEMGREARLDSRDWLAFPGQGERQERQVFVGLANYDQIKNRLARVEHPARMAPIARAREGPNWWKCEEAKAKRFTRLLYSIEGIN